MPAESRRLRSGPSGIRGLLGALGGLARVDDLGPDEFPCFFDNDPSRPTGDRSVVDYRFSASASGVGTTSFQRDGSLSIFLGYELIGAVTFVQSVLFTAECAHLNGNQAPGAGPYSRSGTITITVGADGGVTAVPS